MVLSAVIEIECEGEVWWNGARVSVRQRTQQQQSVRTAVYADAPTSLPRKAMLAAGRIDR